MIVIVFGLPGSGKTYFAGKLASEIRGLHISSDNLRQQHLNEQDKYNEQAKMQIYQSMLASMEKAAPDKNIVLDATFYKENIRNIFKEKARFLDISLYFIEIKADESIIKERVKKKRKETEADFDVYLKLKNIFEPLKEKHLILNSDREALKEMLNKAKKYIKYRDG